MEDINDPKKLRELEYATQFFGFSPDAYIDNLTTDAKDIMLENLEVRKCETVTVVALTKI